MDLAKRKEAVAFSVNYLKRFYCKDSDPYKQLIIIHAGILPKAAAFNESDFIYLIGHAKVSALHFQFFRKLCGMWLDSKKPIPLILNTWMVKYFNDEFSAPKKKAGNKPKGGKWTLVNLCFHIKKDYGVPFGKNESSMHDDYVYAIVRDAARECGLQHELAESTIHTICKNSKRAVTLK